MMHRRQVATIAFSAIAVCGCGAVHRAGHGLPRLDAAAVRDLHVSVAVRPSRIDSLHIAAHTNRRTYRHPRQTALQTSLIFQNRGKHTVRVQSGSLSEFIGNRRLLVVGPRCGYAQRRAGAAVKPGPCLTVAVLPTRIAPGASTNLSVSALVGLPGMKALAAGSYSVSVPLTITRHTTAVTLTYHVKRLSTSSF